MAVLFQKGADFEAEALRSDLFQSMEQIEQAGRALLAAGLLARDEDGRLVAVREISESDLAFIVSAEHKRVEGE